MYPKIIAAGLSVKHAHRSRALHSLHKHKGKHLKHLHVGKGVGHRKLTDAEMNVSHATNKVRRLVPLKIAL